MPTGSASLYFSMPRTTSPASPCSASLPSAGHGESVVGQAALWFTLGDLGFCWRLFIETGPPGVQVLECSWGFRWDEGLNQGASTRGSGFLGPRSAIRGTPER